MPSTRERQIKFMNEFGERAIKDAIGGYLIRNRMTILDLMPDEMVAEITSEMAADWRRAQRNNRRNRAIITQHGLGKQQMGLR